MTDLNLGLLYTLRNPRDAGVPDKHIYDGALEQIRLADALGYDTAWFGEHHFSADGHLPSPLVAAAAAVGVTTRIRLGTCVLPMSFYHPVRLAEDIATLDVLSGGRIDVGIGLGYLPGEFAAYGVARSERLGRMLEGLEILRGLWSQQEFSYAGRFYNVEAARLMPRPVQAPEPPIWIGALHEKAIDRVAKLGYHFMGSAPRSVVRYDAQLRNHGRDPSDFHVWRLLWVHVGQTDDSAWARARAGFRRLLQGYVQQEPRDGIPTVVPAEHEMQSYFEARRRAGGPMGIEPVIGSPETVVGIIQQLCSEARVTHLCMGMQLPGLDQPSVVDSMRRFMRDVRPALGDERASATTLLGEAS